MGTGMWHLKMAHSVLSNKCSSGPWHDSMPAWWGCCSVLTPLPEATLMAGILLDPGSLSCLALAHLSPREDRQEFSTVSLDQTQAEKGGVPSVSSLCYHNWNESVSHQIKQQINPPSLKTPFVPSTTSKLWFLAPDCSVLLFNALIRKHIFASL